MPVSETITIDGIVTRDFVLAPYRSKGSGVVIKGERVIQKLSRRTMRVDEIKEVPASFGDSVNALTSLPGVIRSSGGGFFGPLVIRGADPVYNRYYIDGMPIDNPLHFGGVHSVIANDLMSEIDLYSSSFTSDFGGPIAAVIDINTIDDVDEFGGWADVGFISASALIKTPITKTVLNEKGEAKEENRGYLVASGRLGYLSLLVPLFYRLVMDEKLESVPEYWDYQVKGRYRLDTRTSITMLCLGSRDYWKLLVNEDDIDVDEGDDPMFSDLQMNYDSTFHNQGIYFTYDAIKFRNTLMAYSSWSKHHFYLDAGWAGLAADHWLKDLTIDCVPYIAGGKNSFRWQWLPDLAELRGAVEAAYYYFDAKGGSPQINDPENFDPADPDAVVIILYDKTFSNMVLGGYLEQRFTPGSFVFMPSFRTEWLTGSGFVTYDPRLMTSYRFITDTTVSLAGGHYSSFFQTNPYVFQQDPTYAAQGDTLEPEKAWHCAVGVEQLIRQFTANIEVFYNYYYNLVWSYPHEEDGANVPGVNSGKMRAYGFEFLLKIDSAERAGFFGWGSYTFTTAEYKSGLPLSFDTTGDEWVHSRYEQRHSVKVVAGYRRGKHSLSGRFQLYSSFPYTEIIGSYETPAGSGRFQPVYDYDNPNSSHLSATHQLDLRYTHRTEYEWGHVSWYIEIINIYGPLNRKEDYQWRYNEPYSSSNPEIVESESGLSLIPNFGVEVKF